jgi:hypothetical protein
MVATRIMAFALTLVLASCWAPPSSGPPLVDSNRQGRHHATPDAPLLRKLPNGQYRVRKPWSVHIDRTTYRVPKGYTSNGITAPSAVKTSLGDGVQHEETWAAVFHDWLFTQPGISRAKADGLFYDLLLAYGVSEHKARLMYASVSAYSLRKQGF